MAYDIGPKIGIEGEKEFRDAINQINTNMRTLGTEMKAVSSEFDKGDKSQEAYTAKNGVLNKQIDEQKSKLEQLAKGLQASSDKYGENDKTTQGWQQAVNKATAELNDMEREVGDNVKALDNLGNETEKSGGKFEKFGGIAKGVGIAVGAVTLAAVAAAISMGKKVVEQFGELEQNLGGSEAVFGEYAASIQKTGEDAYKNLGVSQSDYLATANKMGALFQGSGVEQQKSLELTEGAMQRAADMASVMGIDMQVALDSVAGAAKGNFTMMDNLGVAMNATNIEAYALAAGLDFTWKTATQAEKAEVAMQMFFENTQQYAGNFAKESTETISGSLGLMQAALGSFTAGLGNTNADMTNLTMNLVDAFQAVVANVIPILDNIIAVLPAAMTSIVGSLGDLLPGLAEMGTAIIGSLIGAIVSSVPELLPPMIDATLMLLDIIIEVLVDNGPMLIEAGITALLMLITGLINALPKLVEASISIITALVEGLIKALPQLIQMVPQIITTIVSVLTQNLPQIITAAIMIIVALAGALIESIPTIIVSVVQIIGAILKGLLDGIISIITFVPKLFSELVSKFKTIQWGQLGKDIITGIASGVASAAKNLANGVVDAAKGALNSAKKFLGIRSPSTVMRDQVGKMIGVGMAEGIADSAKQVDNAMRGLNGKLAVEGAGGYGVNVGSSGNKNSESVMEHTGTIRLEGVDSKNQVIAVTEIVMNELRREVRSR